MRDPVRKGAHRAALTACAREGEMVADVPDVDGTTGKGRHQPFCRDLPLGQPRRFERHAESAGAIAIARKLRSKRIP